MGGGFKKITRTSSIVKAVAVGAFTNGQACTKRLTGTGTFETSGAGCTEDGLSGGNANDIAASGNSETEAGLQVVATDVAAGDVITFRLTSPDFTITNDVVPTINVTSPNRRARVSWAEAEVPTAPRRARVSHAEVETGIPPRRARVSWSELEVPSVVQPRRAAVSWLEFETPAASRHARISQAYLETGIAPRRARLSWAELESPLAPRRARLSWTELETGIAPRRARLSWAEFEVPDIAGGGESGGVISPAIITHVARYQRLPRSGIGHIHRS